MRVEAVGGVTIVQGDALENLRLLDDQSVHCCVTSPPYWGLRDYGEPGQLGLEPTPDEYVANLVAVFREVKRVLRDDGTVWLNLGDSYALVGKWGGSSGGKNDAAKKSGAYIRNKKEWGDLKSKDLVGTPWRVAFALQADGWYLRQDIIWAKPNPMPESVTDRCTKSHEYIFLLSKSPKYYFDSAAIKEPTVSTHIAGNKSHKGQAAYESGDERMRTKAGLVDYCERQRTKRDSFKRAAKESAVPGQNTLQHREERTESEYSLETRNKHSVWTVTTKPFKAAHFATFPPDLIEPCILAGCPVGGMVLDPFGGSGTTGLVAQRYGRQAVLLELNPAYIDIAVARIAAG